MPKPRFSGGSTSMRRSSSQMPPSESGSSPAMQLSTVDLPQPDGPSSATNSPRGIVTLSASTAVVIAPLGLANRRETRSRRSCLKSCGISFCLVCLLGLWVPLPHSRSEWRGGVRGGGKSDDRRQMTEDGFPGTHSVLCPLLSVLCSPPTPSSEEHTSELQS